MAFDLTFIGNFLIGIFEAKFSKETIGLSKKPFMVLPKKRLVNDVIQKASLCITIQYPRKFDQRDISHSRFLDPALFSIR